jgi:protein-arginine kinase
MTKSIGEVLKKRKDKKKYITREFQDYGYRLAESLNDLKHKSLYIKLAKEEDREVLQQAWEFVKDANAKSKAKLFMWKLKKLRTAKAPQQKQPYDPGS